MQADKKTSGKNEVPEAHTWVLHHQKSWVFEEDVPSIYIKRYLSSTSKNQVIKVEEMEEKPDESLIFKVDDSFVAIKKENSVSEEPFNLIKCFTCDKCKKLFAHESKLNKHMLTHNEVKGFSCDICKKSFTQKSNLNLHTLIHRGVKAFSCEICEKVFTLKDHLNKHMLTHSKVKAFSCEICKKSFTLKCNLAACVES